MKSINSDVIQHYDLLIEENNDPVHDPKPLKDYMDKWDGQAFIDKMDLIKINQYLKSASEQEDWLLRRLSYAKITAVLTYHLRR